MSSAAKRDASTRREGDSGLSQGRRRAEVAAACLYRVVWCPKFARPLLLGIEQEVDAELRAAARDAGAHIVTSEVAADMVSIQLRVEPMRGVHRAVKHLKAHTSRSLRARHDSLRSRAPSLWNNHYFVATLGDEPKLPELLAFLRDQRSL